MLFAGGSVAAVKRQRNGTRAHTRAVDRVITAQTTHDRGYTWFHRVGAGSLGAGGGHAQQAHRRGH